jgi:FixJ family two-component response regulator
LLNAVRNALAQDAERRQFNDEFRRHKLCYEALTTREREVFEGVVAGKPNKQIAKELGTSERTIKAHRSSVMAKMQVGSVPELVRVAEQLHRSGLS